MKSRAFKASSIIREKLALAVYRATFLIFRAIFEHEHRAKMQQADEGGKTVSQLGDPQ
jgi:hypothetical protein